MSVNSKISRMSKTIAGARTGLNISALSDAELAAAVEKMEKQVFGGMSLGELKTHRKMIDRLIAERSGPSIQNSSTATKRGHK